MLNRIGVLGFDPVMAYLMAYDKVMSLYEALTRQGRGGLLAHMIISYPEQEELQQWVIMAPADALGPLLYALSSAPKGFEAVPDPFSGEAVKYTGIQSQLVQQRAISRLISWIASNTNEFTKHQFVEACIRMNKFGERPEHFGQAYCEDRMNLDMFMKDPVFRYSRPDGVSAREAYIQNTSLLGESMDSKCQITYFNRNPDNPGGFSKYVE